MLFLIKIAVAAAIIIGYLGYEGIKLFNKKEETKKFPPFSSKCPDYWDVVGKDKCRNTQKIGVCLTGENNVMDFDLPIFKGAKGDYYKCSWAQKCKAPWEGISNLCA